MDDDRPDLPDPPGPEDPTRFPRDPHIEPLDESPDGRTPSDTNDTEE